MKKESIELEAKKVHENSIYDNHKLLNPDDCWQMAEKNLSIFPDVKVAIPPVYGGYNFCCNAEGSFAVQMLKKPEIMLDHCRELFEQKVIAMWSNNKEIMATYNVRYNPDGFYFISPSGKSIDKVANFIRETENILNIINLTKFNRSVRDDSMWIIPSDFWKQDSMRISVMTILLRCGVHYNGDYRKALLSNSYATQTINALDVFLSGRTKFVGKHDWQNRKNWVHAFLNASKQSAEDLLVA